MIEDFIGITEALFNFTTILILLLISRNVMKIFRFSLTTFCVCVYVHACVLPWLQHSVQLNRAKRLSKNLGRQGEPLVL